MEVIESNVESTELAQLNSELAGLRAETSQILEQVDKDSALSRKRLEVEAARIAVADAALVAKYTSELGPRGIKWDVLPTESGAVILKRPPRALYNEWAKGGMSTDPEELMPVVSQCVLHPSLPVFDQRMTAQPAKLISGAGIVNRLGGASIKDVEGK
jgi:hypothetical protein